ncbi:type VI secretion system protein TssA [Pseudomonas sp. P97.38]|uniref:type VI secretion system protein TssA n=1 Tax=Pseudomonas sp. P97.38 TaxID=255451 RepID=UPI00069ED706|nr:type VI secretion system protein TssA [Pseudomonas sp. P97.38]
MSLPISPLPELVTQLLEPLDAQAPCGQDLRYESVYDRLRELRREDDTSLPAGVWESPIKRAQWPELERLATLMLLERSKDLMISAWLGEAWLHLSGLEGLPSGLALVAGLCERYPEHLHPQAEDGDCSWRVMPLEWLVRRYSEVLLTRVPLLNGDDPTYANFCLHDWQRLQRQQVLGNDSKSAKVAVETARTDQKKLDELIRGTPLSFWLHRQSSLMLSLQHLQRLEAWSDACLGQLAPSYKPLQDVMQAWLALVEEFIAMHPQQPSVAPAPAAPTAATPTEPSQVAPAQVFQEPANREEAYRQLLVIAGYLARTEPHSPVPYLIRRGVEWGNKPLSELLGELISADAESRRLWTLLGVL